jgi:hypothetical protein
MLDQNQQYENDGAEKFARGYRHAVDGEFERSRALLAQAAAAGHADALAWLALHDLYGYGVAVDVDAARAGLAQAERLGSAEARYQLALLGLGEPEVERHEHSLLARLVAAARQDHTAALRGLGLLYLADPLRQDAAQECLARGASLGDRLAAYVLGVADYLSADLERRARAPRLIARAAELGLPRAQQKLTPGAAPSRMTAPAPAMLPAPRLLGDPRPNATTHHLAPLIETIERFYSVPECEYLIAAASLSLRRSVVVEKDGTLVPHPARNSSEASLCGAAEDFAVRWLERRMTSYLGVGLRQAEDLVILRYGPGEQYGAHFDYLPPGGFRNLPDRDQPGQRIHTMFCFLDDVAEGGATVFPRVGRQIRPARGRAVHFTNLDASGSGDPATLHGGAPVIAGEKWLATLWTRERAFRAW